MKIVESLLCYVDTQANSLNIYSFITASTLE